MALNIPNKNMVFVPLDVLTAEELNQIASNVDYIANSFPLAGSQIASSTITPSNLNTNEFASSNPTFTSKDTTPTSTSLVSYRVTKAGLYLVNANISFARNGGIDTVAVVDIKRDNTVVATGSVSTPSNNSRCQAIASTAIYCDVGQYIDIATSSGNGNIWTNNAFSSISITQIA